MQFLRLLVARMFEVCEESDEKCKLIWVFAFIYFDACGVKQGLRNCRFHLQNKIKTRWWDSKNEIGFDGHHVYEYVVVHYLGSTYDS